MARLTEVIASINSLIAGITVANGYTFDWGDINPADETVARYPFSKLRYVAEEPTDSDYRYVPRARVSVEIRVHPDSAAVEGVPFYEVDALIDEYLVALKRRLMRSDQVANEIAGLEHSAVIQYDGFDKQYANTGDIYKPKVLVTRWLVDYYEDINS